MKKTKNSIFFKKTFGKIESKTIIAYFFIFVKHFSSTKYDKEIEFELELNEKFKITVNNSKEDKVIIENNKQEMNVENNKSELIVSNNEKETNIVNNLEIQKEKTTNTSKVINENKVKKLPVTGM